MERLPPELVLYLGPFLAPSAAGSLVRAARRYHALLTPCLYEHVLQPADEDYNSGDDAIAELCLRNSSYSFRPPALRFSRGVARCMGQWQSPGIVEFFKRMPVERLLALDCDSDQLVLMTLVAGGTVQVVRCLLERHIGQDKPSADGYSDCGPILECHLLINGDKITLPQLVIYTAGNGPEERLQMVLDLVKNVIGDEGLKAAINKNPRFLHGMAKCGNTHGLQLLLDHGASVMQSDNGIIALHIVAQRTSIEDCKIILDATREAGGNISQPNYPGATALHMAILKQNTQIAKLLIEAGADTAASGYDGRTPLQIAIACSQADVVERILDFCPQNKLSVVLYDQLIYAARELNSGEVQAIMDLIRKRNITVDLSKSDLTNRYILDYIITERNPIYGDSKFRGIVESIKVLVEAGAPIDSQEPPLSGNTILHRLLSMIPSRALPSEYLPVIDLLHFTRGDGTPIKNTSGVTPLLIAVARGLPEATARIVDLLQGATPSLTVKDNCGHNALHRAVFLRDQKAKAEIIDKLLAAGLDPNDRAVSGFTVLGLAASIGSLPVLQQLEKGGADVNAVSHQTRSWDDEPDSMINIHRAGGAIHKDCAACQNIREGRLGLEE